MIFIVTGSAITLRLRATNGVPRLSTVLACAMLICLLALPGCGGGSDSNAGMAAGGAAGASGTGATGDAGQSTALTTASADGTNTGDAVADDTSGASLPAPASGTTTVPEATSAYTYLDAQRVRCGFGPLTYDARLASAANAHAHYLMINNVSGHSETSGLPGFTGTGGVARAIAAGYPAQKIGDNISFATGTNANVITGRGAYAVQSLLSAPYHALSLIADFLDIGVAVLSSDETGTTATFGARSITQVDLGLQTGADGQEIAPAAVLTYPCAGTTGTSTVLRNETPNPLPGRNLTTQPAGQPVMIKVRTGQILTITSVSMTRSADGTPVALLPVMTSANDPNSILGPDHAVVFPDEALQPGTQYTVSVAGTNTTATEVNGVLTSTGTNPAISSSATGGFSQTFSFTTAN